MKYIDNFLKKLKTDRNTFATYILTLISIYIVIDRVAEILLIGFSGISVSYWGPLKYTLALACPVFAFYFSFASKFVTYSRIKYSFLYLYAIILYTVSVSMFVQWINKAGWLLLFSVPNYSYIISTFMDLIRPAFSAMAWYIPVTTFYPLFKFIYLKVNDMKDIRDSITDYPGIDLSNNKEGTGPYTCEIVLCKDRDTSKIVKIPENRRYEAMLVTGPSGSGKTSMIFEPMIARDLEKKYFLKEASKEVGFTALRTGIANLNCPYANDYLNENFSLNMLTPVSNKEKIYKAYVSKLAFSYAGENSVFKDLGLTYLAPDFESLSHMIEIADNFGIDYHVIDPNNPNSVGLNPFAFKDPMKAAISVSAILKRMAETKMDGKSVVASEVMKQTSITQAIENITLLLKEMYPIFHDNALPTLENLLDIFNNPDQIEIMAEQMKEIPDLAEKYKIQLDYFKKMFYKNVTRREENLQYLQMASSQLELLLRYPSVKNVICNQTNNINYDSVLKNGEVVFICTRRGDLGATVHKSFGLFILLLMQHSVLSRPGIEKTRLPHFLYIDEFPPFMCKATEDIFTLYRKYRVGAIVSTQNLSQFVADNFKNTVLANSTTKVTFGNNTPADNEFWSKEFGDHREWIFQSDYDSGKVQYSPTYKSIKWDWKANIKPGEVQALAFKTIVYKTKDIKGKMTAGKGKVDFLESKYKEKQKIKVYNFSKFTNGINIHEVTHKGRKHETQELEDDEPFKTTQNSHYKFDDEDPIIHYKKS